MMENMGCLFFFFISLANTTYVTTMTRFMFTPCIGVELNSMK